MVLTDWRILLAEGDGYQMRPAATEQDVALHEERLREPLPLQLKNLYLVSNGVYDRAGQWFVVWALPDLAPRNELEWAADAAGRRELLAFGDDGAGARFCVPRDGGPGVFLWSSLVEAPSWLANDVGDFWLGRTAAAHR